MRIVGGELKGRKLSSPPGQVTRPTSDRVREALFNILEHGIEGFQFEGAYILDLFAGTGALGLEALSRGSSFCLFVDNDIEARGAIRNNIEAFQLTGIARLWKRDALTLGKLARMKPFNLVFVDPPYGKGLSEQALKQAAADGWLAKDAVIVIEEGISFPISLVAPFVAVDKRIYGETTIHFYRYNCDHAAI